MRRMRRLACAFLIFLTLFQWSWVAAHAMSDASGALASVVNAADGAATAEASEALADCAAPSHCCHLHSLGLPVETAGACLPMASDNLAEQRALLPAELAVDDIERPKWATASVAVAIHLGGAKSLFRD